MDDTRVEERASQRLKRRYTKDEIEEIIKDRISRPRRIVMSVSASNCVEGCACINESDPSDEGGNCPGPSA